MWISSWRCNSGQCMPGSCSAHGTPQSHYINWLEFMFECNVIICIPNCFWINFRNTPSTAGNSMTGSERPSPEPLLKKEASPAVLGGENSGNALEPSNALKCRAWGIPAVLSRGIPGKALRAFPGSSRIFFWNFFRKLPAVLGLWVAHNYVTIFCHIMPISHMYPQTPPNPHGPLRRPLRRTRGREAENPLRKSARSARGPKSL